MPIRRTLWRCPRCNELKPTRHESVLRHIGRKHASLGEPLSVTTGETRNQMLVSGSLAPVQRSFLRKPSPGPGFSDNSSTIASDNKNKQIKDSRGSSDLFDKMITFYQLGLVKETNQKVQTILETLAEIDGLKGSRNNSSAGDFA